jgi:glutathione S-transferase
VRYVYSEFAIVIILHQFPPALGLPNASPFCLKLELYLRMTGLPYLNRYTINPQNAPKGKLPWIDDDGTALADSGLIIDYLKQKFGDPLDNGLSVRERAEAVAITRLLEEHLYWAVLYTRWIDEAGWPITREGFFGRLSWPLRWVVPPLARRGMRTELHGHGMGRHSPEEIMRLGVADIAALSGLLGSRPYFLGDQPTSVDATAMGFLANLLMVELDTPLKVAALSHENLVGYCRRMAERYFP